MTPWTILKLLVGNREAILTAASTRWSLLIGAILVLSGSLARNYDGACYPQEWHGLTHGLGVSTVNAFILFAMVYVASGAAKRGLRFFRGYLSFLGLFWLTAPMAWLYGIPYERFMPAIDALHANAYTLAVVSVWRVTLVSRVLAVQFGERTRRVIWITMVFADVTLVLALLIAPLPVIDFMGGLQQLPEERELGSMAFIAGFWGVLTLPVWIIGALIAAARMKGDRPLPAPPAPARSAIPALAFASIMLAAWIAAAVWAHPQQKNRYQAEQLLRANHVQEALAYMSTHQRTDYPPVWNPPPRPAWRIYDPDIKEIRAVLLAEPHARWVEDLFWSKCWRDMQGFGRDGFAPWIPISEWKDNVQADHPSAEWWADAAQHAGHDTHLSPEDRQHLQAAIDAWKGLPRNPPANADR